MEISLELKIPKTGLTSGRAAVIVTEEITGAMEAGLAKIKGAVQPRTPVGVTANLRGAWNTDLRGTPLELRGRVFNAISYVLPVEMGSKAHWPPRGPLELWVRRKLGVSEKEVRGVAFVIARAIAQRGTRAVKMAQNGFASVKVDVVLGFERALARIRARLESPA